MCKGNAWIHLGSAKKGVMTMKTNTREKAIDYIGALPQTPRVFEALDELGTVVKKRRGGGNTDKWVPPS